MYKNLSLKTISITLSLIIVIAVQGFVSKLPGGKLFLFFKKNKSRIAISGEVANSNF